MASNQDPRIGRGDQWPDTTISGQAYTRPCSTLTLANGDFLVLDRFPPPNEAELLAPFIGDAVALDVVKEEKGVEDEQS